MELMGLELLTPKEASVLLKMSRASITRCKNEGAPVYYWGCKGSRYRINISEFVAWMDARGKNKEIKQPKMIATLNVTDMAEARRAHVRALGKGGLNHAAV